MKFHNKQSNFSTVKFAFKYNKGNAFFNKEPFVLFNGKNFRVFHGKNH